MSSLLPPKEEFQGKKYFGNCFQSFSNESVEMVTKQLLQLKTVHWESQVILIKFNFFLWHMTVSINFSLASCVLWNPLKFDMIIASLLMHLEPLLRKIRTAIISNSWCVCEGQCFSIELDSWGHDRHLTLNLVWSHKEKDHCSVSCSGACLLTYSHSKEILFVSYWTTVWSRAR